MQDKHPHATSAASDEARIRFHRLIILPFVAAAVFLLAGLAGCDRSSSPVVLPLSKINADNYNKLTLGMSKTQVETILGQPTTAESKDMVIFKRTTYRYEDGDRFILLTFKNEELDSKDGNLAAAR